MIALKIKKRERILTKEDVKLLTGKTIRTINKLIEQHIFPESISIGKNKEGWLFSEVIAWLEKENRVSLTDIIYDLKTEVNLKKELIRECSLIEASNW
jgi:predicted DNA-binding transcriptional regulator AlpA